MRRNFLSLCLALMIALTGCSLNASPIEDSDDLPPWYTQEIELPEAASPEPLLPTSFALPYQRDRSLDPIVCDTDIQANVAALLFEPLFFTGQNLYTSAGPLYRLGQQ